MRRNSRKTITFSKPKRRTLEADFDGYQVSSDRGLLLLRETDRKLNLIRSVPRRLHDPRQEGKVQHAVETMLRQRMIGLCVGWEDLNDAEQLRHDTIDQIAAGDEALASAPTLCRLENRQSRATALAVNAEFVEQFIASHRKAPAKLMLDYNAMDTPVHGKQEDRFFHGDYDWYYFLPLYVFCGDQLLVAYLRPSNIDPAWHAAAILKLLVRRLRQAWPRTKIVLRVDSGFCRDPMLSWCDRNDVKHVVGIARNERLLAAGSKLMRQAEREFARTGYKQRLFAGFDYAALTWNQVRWVIAKAEHTDKGSNPRFAITNIVGDP